jgi:predicted DNA-binding protein
MMKEKSEGDIAVYFRVSEELLIKLKNAAKNDRRTVSAFIRCRIEDILDEREKTTKSKSRV